MIRLFFFKNIMSTVYFYGLKLDKSLIKINYFEDDTPVDYQY